MLNPLFSGDDSDDKPKDDKGYVIGNRHGRTIQPLSKGLIPPSPAQRHESSDTTQPMSTNAAVELIRRKVEAIYGEEPPAKQEIKEVKQEPAKARSKHQQFMYELSTSGKSLAQIQTEWHNYYVHLPDDEKHEVWHEFYANNNRPQSTYSQMSQQPQAPAMTAGAASHEQLQPRAVVAEHTPPTLPHSDRRSAARIKKKIVNRVLASESAQQKAKQHFKSLLFGISTGLIVLIVFLFSF